MACSSGDLKAAAPPTTISGIHSDIIQTNILTRLDGPSLASTATTCSQLHTLCSDEHLWANTCNSTWPSTTFPRIRHVISTFPNASRSFFADSFPSPDPTDTATTNPDLTPQLISAVDLFHRQRLLFSKVVETETVTGWFRSSPFRVDLLDPKEVIKYPVAGNDIDIDNDTCRDLGEELRLSWIVIDPASRRAVNVSSGKAVTVERHWLSGEVRVRFATVVKGERGTASELALCSVVVTWGGGKVIGEVCLEVEDMDGKHVNGRDSLVILQRALEGGRKWKEEGGGCCCYREFMKRKEEREERRKRAERIFDMVFLGVGLAALTSVALFVLWRNCDRNIMIGLEMAGSG